MFLFIAAPGIIDLDTSRESNTVVKITWFPPTQPNGIIIRYQVVYSIIENTTTKSIDVDGSNTTTVVEELGKYIAKCYTVLC